MGTPSGTTGPEKRGFYRLQALLIARRPLHSRSPRSISNTVYMRKGERHEYFMPLSLPHIYGIAN
jgi:hypothetical protein